MVLSNSDIAGAALSVAIANPPKSPYQQRIEAGEKPVQAFLQPDLATMLDTLLKRDNLKIGDWLPWAVAVAINESDLKDGDGNPLKYDMTKLQPHVRKPREKVSDLREQLRQTQELMRQMMENFAKAQQPAPTPPSVIANERGEIVAK